MATVTNDLQTVSPVMVGDDFGATADAGWRRADDPWWPYLPVVLGAALVALGAMLFSPGGDSTPAPCAAACAPAPDNSR